MGRHRRLAHDIGSNKGNPVCTSHHLRNLLLLDNNPGLFQRFKHQLYHLAEKHLDIKDAPCRQTDALIAIETELLSFPGIFEGDTRETLLHLAMKMIVAHHNQRRHASKKRAQAMNDSPQKRGLTVFVSVPTTAALRKKREGAKRREEVMKREEDIIYITDDDDDHHENQKVESKPQPGPDTIKIASRTVSPLGSISSSIAGLSTLWSPTTPTQSESTLHHAESSSQAQSSNASSNQGNPEDAFQLTGVSQVARFLNSCFPSMAHLLKHFVDFGCTSEEYLLAVSTWPTDRISYFLNQVSGHGSNERKLSEMDILVLQDHFISYFNKAQA